MRIPDAFDVADSNIHGKNESANLDHHCRKSVLVTEHARYMRTGSFRLRAPAG